MVILNIFGEIEEIIISHKLGITISNLSKEWLVEIVENMKEEIHNREFDIKKFNKYDNRFKNYNLSDVVSHENFKGLLELKDSEEKNLEEIASKLICIQVGDYDNSYLKNKNRYIDNPTCEKEFEEKFIHFYSFITKYSFNSKNNKWNVPFSIYSSERARYEETRMLNFITASIKQKAYSSFSDSRNIIDDLIEFGKLIDSYLDNYGDFQKLDYLINALYDDNNYNAFHLFKVFSLIEMLIINPQKKLYIELEEKLPYFIIDNDFKSDDEKKGFVVLIRKIRNKIAHGDFMAVKKLLEDYATKYMKHFWFDYYEYSRENWIYLSICCRLDEIVSKIIWQLIYDKKVLYSIQNGSSTF
ncbi:hypothetical protein [Pseudalkalibacillus salsuginis]|uniref:hypothetical protein n=1 Tax=Pseudalkalibacillus salsuginis TaxID=2910972 RepID=UPI001F254510|nr:hypothetical protein [Pseudalkalibacillus salsuginis]MCF6411497.1 hypothetical protein [Pseudalkalibacillus salsuginis]